LRYDDRLKATGSSADRPPTYEAYRVFSDGMNHYVAVENSKALPLFLEAYRIDSTFTVALLYASIALTNVASWSRADSLLQLVNVRRNSLSEYNRAWLDYRLAFVHGNRGAALAAMRLASREAPESKASYNHALEALYSGYLQEALSALQSLPADRGPMRDFAPYWDVQGTILHCMRRYSDEQAIARKSLLVFPNRLTLFRSMGRSFVIKGQLDSLALMMKRAEDVPTDPVGWDYGHLLSEIAEELRTHGNPDAANLYFEKLRLWLLNTKTATNAKWRLVNALYALSQWDATSKNLSELRRSDSTNVEYLGMSGLIYSRTGNRQKAALVMDSLGRDKRPYQFGAGSYYRARIAATLGEKDAAVAALNQSLSEGRLFNLPIHRERDFESLHGYPAFELLLRGKN
jgi:predicted Zn-dependent protease